MPSTADRKGNLLDFTNTLAGNPITGVVAGPYLANLLSQKLGYGVSPNEPHYVPGCNLAGSQARQSVFHDAIVPHSVWSVPAQKMLQYIPIPNTPRGTYATSAYSRTLRDDINY